jgi:hypothetical protein
MTVKQLIKKLSRLNPDLHCVMGCGSAIEMVKVEPFDSICPGADEETTDEDVVLIG